MISACTDHVQQDPLIERYMQLPNQVWDDIINQASKNVDVLKDHVSSLFYSSEPEPSSPTHGKAFCLLRLEAWLSQGLIQFWCSSFLHRASCFSFVARA